MASAWGLSFGKAFGNSFGRMLAVPEPLPPATVYDWGPTSTSSTGISSTSLARKRRQQEEEALILMLLGISSTP
jgi:hypothetical protein